MTKELEKICEFIDEVKKKYPEAKLFRNGDIQYCNGNDGTEFDWKYNGRLCEFGCGTEDNSVWAFKCLVDADGTTTVYCYPNGEENPLDIVSRKLLSEGEVISLYKHMSKEYDQKLYFDCFLDDVEQTQNQSFTH